MRKTQTSNDASRFVWEEGDIVITKAETPTTTTTPPPVIQTSKPVTVKKVS